MRNPAVVTLTRALVPLAAYAALSSLARFEVNATAAAETGYLAFLAVGVLLAISALAVRPELEAGLASLLAVTAVWVLPAGPGRGATLTVLLTAALAAVTLRRLRRDSWRLSWVSVVAVAVALQFLWRADALLAPHSRAAGMLVAGGLPGEGWLGGNLLGGGLPATVFDLLVLPCLGAAAVVVLASRWRPEAILAATAALLILGSGWSPIGIMILLVLAAVDVAWTRRARSPWLPVLAVALALSLLTVALGLLNWRTPVARGWRESLRLLAWIPILAPVTVIAILDWPSRTQRLWQAKAPRLWQTQALWSGSLLVGGGVLAGYPWLRIDPADSLLNLIGLRPGWTAAALVVTVALVIGLSRWPRPATLGGLTLFIAVVLALPTTGPVVLSHRSLTAAAPTATAQIAPTVQIEPAAQLEPPVAVTSVAVDSYLSYGSLVPAGAPVARLRLRGAGGRSEEWTLRNGRETGEWAARRPDIAASPTLQTPPAWISRVTAERLFFGQQYRAVHQLPTPLVVESIEVTLEPGVAPEVALTLVGLELRP